MEVYAVGVDHHLAPLEVRERIALDAQACTKLAAQIHAEPWAAEVLWLSTCNRTELYVVTAEPDGADLGLNALLRFLPGAPAAHSGAYRRLAGEAAVLHLLRVATGLESAILGETEIQGQVRAAHERGQRDGQIGLLLERLCQAALRVGKRARAQTRISEGSISHGHAAAQVVRRVFDRMDGHRVLLVGAGEIAAQAGRALRAMGTTTLTVANRTAAHAQALAEELGGAHTVGLDGIADELAVAHVVLLATATQVLTRSTVEQALRRRRDPLLLVDLGVPRCVEPSVGELPGVFLYDLAALESMVAAALSTRREAVPVVETLLQHELEQWRTWQRSLGALPTIRTLTEWAEEIRQSELAWLPPHLDAETRAAVERLSERLVQRLLGRATARVVRGTSAPHPELPTPEQLERVFGLRKDPDA